MKQKFNEIKKFSIIAVVFTAITVLLAYHVADILFGDNSLEFYNKLKDNKKYLQSEINRLQKQNAYLQKEYFELKNLEPEE